MDKDKNDSGKIIKLDNKERKILRTIDKSSKWEDIKAIKDINEEILDLDIYKDFIGLGCSRYMNESADSGKLDIEEMFRNCREAEKVRVRVKKKARREEAQTKGGRRGRGGGNIGQLVKGNQDKSIKDIPSKQGEKKSSAVVDKARSIGDKITKVLKGTIKGGDWKDEIAKLGLELGMDTIFGIIIGVLDYSVEDPVGSVVITSGMFGLMGSIYAYINDTNKGKRIIGKISDWFLGKFNELLKHLFGEGINDLFDDFFDAEDFPDDADDPDDKDNGDDKGGVGGSGSKGGLSKRKPKGGQLTFTADDIEADRLRLNYDRLNEYSNENEIKEEEETKEERKEETQDLTGERQTQRRGQLTGDLDTIIPYLLQQQNYQQQQNLVNANNERLLQRNANNPMPNTGGEELTPPKAKKEAPPQEPDRPEQKAESLNPESLNPDRPTRGGMFGGLGQDERKAEETGKDTTGRAGLRDFAKDSFGAYSMYRMGSKLYEAMGSPFSEGGEILGQAQAGMEGTGVGGTGEEFFDAQQNPLDTPQPNTQSTTLLPQMRGGIEPRYNRANSLTQTDITRTNLTPDQQAEMDNARKEIKEQAEQIKRDKERKQEQEKKINQAIDDMDLRGRAWGLVNPGSQGGKTGADSLSSLITGIGLTDRARTQIEMRDNILSNVRQDEQNTLLNDIQEQERLQYESNLRERNRNKKLQKENKRLKAQMSLVEAREKGIDEKMTPDQAEAVADQEIIEREINPPMEDTSPPIEDTSPPVEQEEQVNPAMEVALQVIGGRPRNPDIVLLYELMGRPYRQGSRSPNEVLYSYFNDNSWVPEEARPMVATLIAEFKASRKGTTVSKLRANEINKIAEIIIRHI